MSAFTYPGVYVKELPSGVRTITGVATSITAFIGRALAGPVNEPTMIHSFAEYESVFGGMWSGSSMSYAVRHYFQNGGRDAIIVRVHNGATSARLELAATTGDPLKLDAADPGAWGKALRATVDYDTSDEDGLFNLTVREFASDDEEETEVIREEVFRNLSTSPDHTRYVGTVLEEESDLVEMATPAPTSRPSEIEDAAFDDVEGKDGDLIANAQINSTVSREGIDALEAADLFNLLCIPPLRGPTEAALEITANTWEAAAAYCTTRRAMLIVDPPASWDDVSDVTGAATPLVTTASGANAMLFFPRVRVADPLQEFRAIDFAACGAVAGVIARTDGNRGVWKAAAGLETALSGVSELTVKLTDAQNGELNPLGVNCLRTFPVYGNVVWGARTMVGADRLASQWKYAPVRRTALFIEESLYRGTQWAVFEPNDEPLWAQIRLNVGAFMHNLFRQGAFQGTTPRDAYLVKCDSETTTQNDINLGIVNILVGFAPLKPAEFVVLQIQQLAGQVET